MEINKKIEKITKDLLKELGEDPSREGLLKTPSRVAKSWSFLTSGYKKDLKKLVNKVIWGARDSKHRLRSKETSE